MAKSKAGDTRNAQNSLTHPKRAPPPPLVEIGLPRVFAEAFAGIAQVAMLSQNRSKGWLEPVHGDSRSSSRLSEMFIAKGRMDKCRSY
jgi:hypothetical protein